MQARVAEFHMRTGLALRKKTKLRVDLHGVSVFGPRDAHTLIRWEWITEMTAGGGVFISSADKQIRFPDGAFGLPSGELLDLLQTARSIEHRGEVIGRLCGAASS